MNRKHKRLISGISKQLKRIFESSEQAMYVYLDDLNKVCNQKFSAMLGYKSPAAWAKVEQSFPAAFVAEKSQMDLINAFQRAMRKGIGSTIPVTWKKKSGSTVNTNVILVPIALDNHPMALHFISRLD